jgi:flagellar biosynthesis/type III secretory pathway M-ring protein FliF/YscJ
VLIAARLWYITDQVTTFTEIREGMRKMKAVQMILIESATMYAVSMLVYLITYKAKTNYSIIFGDMVSVHYVSDVQ